MMGRLVDLTGQRFGHLTVLRRDENRQSDTAYWICRCDCGNEKSICGKLLRKLDVISCGCPQYSKPRKPMYKDITGQKFFMLTALEHDHVNKRGETYWRCICDCGKELLVSYGNLAHGNQRSCGCTRTAFLKEYNPRTKTTHGASTPDSENGINYRLYKTWCSIHQRCGNPNAPAYRYYGGRGIRVCEEWDSFEPFRDWSLENGFDPNLPGHQCSIDRIDVNGNYSPDNCRWVDSKTQSNNRRNNKRFTISGENHTMSEWCEIYGVPKRLVKDRVHNGWDIVRALTEPKHISNSHRR